MLWWRCPLVLRARARSTRPCNISCVSLPLRRPDAAETHVGSCATRARAYESRGQRTRLRIFSKTPRPQKRPPAVLVLYNSRAVFPKSRGGPFWRHFDFWWGVFWSTSLGARLGRWDVAGLNTMGTKNTSQTNKSVYWSVRPSGSNS